MINSIWDAALVLSRYGNISNNPQELIDNKPTGDQLKRAGARCHQEIDLAMEKMCEYHNIELELPVKPVPPKIHIIREGTWKNINK